MDRRQDIQWTSAHLDFRETLLKRARRRMTDVLNEILSANAEYARNFGEMGTLLPRPVRAFSILTCVNVRVIPEHFAGVRGGNAHVIRNAGGRASDDAIRSLVISHKLLGQGFSLVRHSDCGMMLLTDDVMGDLLAQSLDTAQVDENGSQDVGQRSGSNEGRFVKWLRATRTAAGRLPCVCNDQRLSFPPLSFSRPGA